MEYILDDIVFEMRYCDGLEQLERISKYYYAMKEQVCSKSEINNRNNALLKIFLEKEIDWEKRIYAKMKKWEERHPILGIIICTILLGILISLIAGIILEAVY